MFISNTAYSSALVACVVVYLLVHLALSSSSRCSGPNATDDADVGSKAAPERHPKVLMLLSTFAVSVTYLAGLNAPGGFWDDQGAGDGHRPGDAVLKGGRHDARLKAFFVCNTTAFVASLLILVLLLEKKLRYSPKVRSFELYGFIVVALVGLVAAYSAGSSREVDTTIYVNSLIAAVLVCILVQVVIVKYLKDTSRLRNNYFWKKLERMRDSSDDAAQPAASVGEQQAVPTSRALEKTRSLVLLLATLAAAITYQAGLSPPGGLWQDAGAGYKAGDPILLTTNPRRYKAFYYCNSVAFVASVVVVVLVRRKTLQQHNTLEATMVLDLIGLIGAYAAGSCRDVTTSIYAVGLGGAVLVYVVIHVILFTLDRSAVAHDDEASLEKRRKRLLLFAILAATITYQAGLTPPSGFLLEDDETSGHRAGDPVLLHNHPRRYKTFFYCNSVSFMLSIALIMILVNPNVYRPAIRSNALSVCTAVGLVCIMGAYAAGSTQHLKTSIHIFALVAAVLASVVFFVVVFLLKNDEHEDRSNGSRSAMTGDVEMDAARVKAEAKELHAKRKYLMLLGILVATVTYQAGLAPPGGVWQSDGAGHAAGDPVMHDNRRARYMSFFYCNSTSFVASIVVVILLLPEPLQKEKWWLGVMNATVVLDLLGLLVAYAAGSGRSWRTSAIVSALVVPVLAYFVIHVVLSCFRRRGVHMRLLPDNAG